MKGDHSETNDDATAFENDRVSFFPTTQYVN